MAFGATNHNAPRDEQQDQYQANNNGDDTILRQNGRKNEREDETFQPLLPLSVSAPPSTDPSSPTLSSSLSTAAVQLTSSLLHSSSQKMTDISSSLPPSLVRTVPVTTGYGSTNNSPNSNSSPPQNSKRYNFTQSRSTSSFELQQYYQSSSDEEYEDNEEDTHASTSLSFSSGKGFLYKRGRRLSQRLSRRRKKVLFRIIIAFIILSCLIFIAVRQTTKKKSSSSSTSDTDENIKMKKRTSSSSLSKLHPIDDLKLLPFIRPEVSQPSSLLYGSSKAKDDHSFPSSSQEGTKKQTQQKEEQQQQQQQKKKKQKTQRAKPTNAWYQNLLLLPNGSQPTNSQRVYSIPYILDIVGTIPGLRLHKPSVDATSKVVSLNNVERHGITLGISYLSSDERGKEEEQLSKAYKLLENEDGRSEESLTPLGISLEWDVDSIASSSDPLSSSYSLDLNKYTESSIGGSGSNLGYFQKMTSSIVRGMPYVTMHYHYHHSGNDDGNNNFDNTSEGRKSLRESSPTSRTAQIIESKTIPCPPSPHQLLPTISSEIKLRSPPIVDDKNELHCFSSSSKESDREMTKVEKEIKLIFDESDFTYLVFYSRPVYVQCLTDDLEGMSLKVVEFADPENKKEKKRNIDISMESQRIEKEIVKENVVQEEADLTIRITLANQCTLGRNPIFCSQLTVPEDQKDYMALLRKHADIYPGKNTRIDYKFHSSQEENTMNREEGEEDVAMITFDWDAQNMRKRHNVGSTSREERVEEEDLPLLVYALPHHADSIISAKRTEKETGELSVFVSNDSSNGKGYFCTPSLIGKACIILSSTWTLRENILPIHNSNNTKQNIYSSLPVTTTTPREFRAPRPPHPTLIQTLVEALSHDVKFQLPEYYQRGAGDTYFSAKMLAKLGRIIMIADELRELASLSETLYFDDDDIKGNLQQQQQQQQQQQPTKTIEEEKRNYLQDVVRAVHRSSNLLPTDNDLQSAISRLRSSVEIWINGTAEANFVYDSSYGGVVNCGCSFGWDGFKLTCMNQYPDCPAFTDPGLNFGNGFYNDHHFHYGYIIYAAAVVSHFDHVWGKKYFEDVILFVRDIANPSVDDIHFPMFRHKDWYMGHSWASGISKPSPFNGRNQESSSESIAAYEAIGLYGSVMMTVWGDNHESLLNSDSYDKVEVSRQIRNTGRLLTATELHSTDRYYHVRHNNDDEGEHKQWQIYPSQYTPHVVGMLWNTMAEFQTWFGGAAFSSYGIQLMPLTPIAEQRDDLSWLSGMYNDFAESCEADRVCTEQGWSVVQFAALASVGHRALAVEKALSLPPSVFESAGGNGHSLTNTLWYAATRPEFNNPLVLFHSTN